MSAFNGIRLMRRWLQVAIVKQAVAARRGMRRGGVGCAVECEEEV
jgi:hypothetical protein